MFGIFRRRATRDEAWTGVVTDRKRGIPDGQTVVFRITVSLDDGSTRNVRVRRSLYRSLDVGDHVVKHAGDRNPVKAGQESSE
jgi:hypothetical protein